MFDNAVWSVLLQAFNTETTENHGGARSGSDDESPQAVLQQPRMEIEWRLSRTLLMEPEFGPPGQPLPPVRFHGPTRCAGGLTFL